MTFVASAFSDDVFLLDCSAVILQKEIYVVVFFWGVTPDLRRLLQNPSIAQLFLTPISLFYFYILRE